MLIITTLRKYITICINFLSGKKYTIQDTQLNTPIKVIKDQPYTEFSVQLDIDILNLTLNSIYCYYYYTKIYKDFYYLNWITCRLIIK